MIIYSSILILALLSDICSETLNSRSAQWFRKISFIVLSIILILVSALRYEVGQDYQHYINVFYWINEVGRTYEEAGFIYLNKILWNLGLGYQSVFLFSSVLIGVCVYFFFKSTVTSKYWSMAIFLYAALGFYFSSMNIFRQYMALGLGLIAFIFYIRRNFLMALVFLILGVLFHTTILIIVLLPIMHWIIMRLRGDAWLLIFVAVSICLFMVGTASLIGVGARLLGYQQYDTGVWFDRNVPAVLKGIFPAIILFYGYYHIQSSIYKNLYPRVGLYARNANLVSYLLSGTILFTCFSIIFAGNMILTRLTEYFSPFYIAFICYIFRVLRGMERTLFWLFVVLYAVANVTLTIFMGNGNNVLPYQFCSLANLFQR